MDSEAVEGEVVIEEKPQERGKTRRVKPSAKMIRYIQYRNDGLNMRQAQLKAGYTLSSANRGGLIEKRKQYKQALIDWNQKFNDAGLSQDYMIIKFKEWLEAQQKKTEYVGKDDKGKPMYETVERPDYETQLKAYDRWKQNVDPDSVKSKARVTEKITLERFVLGDEYKGEDEL